jgi:hypothetical protein
MDAHKVGNSVIGKPAVVVGIKVLRGYEELEPHVLVDLSKRLAIPLDPRDESDVAADVVTSALGCAAPRARSRAGPEILQAMEGGSGGRGVELVLESFDGSNRMENVRETAGRAAERVCYSRQNDGAVSG